jgi:hypothetical protein
MSEPDVRDTIDGISRHLDRGEAAIVRETVPRGVDLNAEIEGLAEARDVLRLLANLMTDDVEVRARGVAAHVDQVIEMMVLRTGPHGSC